MATPGGNGGPTQSPSAQPGQAQLKVVGQYIKDLSFKNPNAPRSLAPTETQPAINIQINVIVQQLAQTDHEVALKLEGKAESAGSVLFAFELTFAGVFRVQNVPAETLQPLVMIECPRLLSRSRARSSPTRCATAASPRSCSIPWISSRSISNVRRRRRCRRRPRRRASSTGRPGISRKR
jgi:protein-export chaperone SecB